MIRVIPIDKAEAIRRIKQLEQEFGITTDHYLALEWPKDEEVLSRIGSFDSIEWSFLLDVLKSYDEREVEREGN